MAICVLVAAIRKWGFLHAMAPRVSICIPAYNHGRFLGAAIESALSQTWTDLEVVVSDNRSTDDTEAVVAPFVQRDARVRYELAPTHVGMAENFNRSLALARGEYVKFLCADDLLEPQCVERLVTAMAGEDVVLAGCARYLADESNTIVGETRYAKSGWRGPGDVAARRCFFLGNLIGEPTAVMFRRRDAREGFSARYTQLIDLDFWFRLLERGGFAFVATPLCRVRVHPGRATQRNADSGHISGNKQLLFSDYANRPYMRGTLAQRLLWDFRMAWSQQREPAPLRSLDRGLFYPRLWGAMVIGAALAWRVRLRWSQ
jgi:glycosyltransferase involved in cell wall biosynthesis